MARQTGKAAPLSPFITDEASKDFQPDLQDGQLESAWDLCDVARRNPEHLLLPCGVDGVLPGWMQHAQGWEMLCKSAARSQELAQLRESAETGQPVPIKDPDTPERNALVSELARVAGPCGWQDDSDDEATHEGAHPVYVPRGGMLQLLEGATTHLAAINWEWEHALPRAAFLTTCIARILDDKRVSEVIDGLPQSAQDLSLRLSKALVRSPYTAEQW
jgi:hypothetical protein